MSFRETLEEKKKMERVYKMGMYVNNKLVYIIEVEADSIEEARELTWGNFEMKAYADEIQECEQEPRGR